MSTWTLNYHGPVMGAVRMTQKTKWTNPQARKCNGYKAALRFAADAAGIPGDLEPTKGYGVEMIFRFKGRARYDCDNLAKFVLDALWKNDRRVISLAADVFEYRDNEETSIRVYELQAPRED